MILFAQQFGLRCQDYTKGTTSPYPTIFTLHLNNRKRIMTFTIMKSKGKQKSKPEILTFKCQHINDGCIYCILLDYQKAAKKRGIKCKAFFTKKNKRSYQPFCENRFREILKERFTRKYGKNYDKKKYRSHGIRHGRASELVRKGTPIEIARRVLRHAPGSMTVERYVHLTPDDLADLIAKYDKVDPL